MAQVEFTISHIQIFHLFVKHWNWTVNKQMQELILWISLPKMS